MVEPDHKPIVATIEDKIPRRHNQFRFNKRRVGQDVLMDSISKGWELNSGRNGPNFVDEIGNCKRKISR